MSGTCFRVNLSVDNFCGVDLTDIQLINKFNKGIRFFKCFIEISSKYTWAVLLTDKKGVTITNAF